MLQTILRHTIGVLSFVGAVLLIPPMKNLVMDLLDIRFLQIVLPFIAAYILAVYIFPQILIWVYIQLFSKE